MNGDDQTTGWQRSVDNGRTFVDIDVHPGAPLTSPVWRAQSLLDLGDGTLADEVGNMYRRVRP